VLRELRLMRVEEVRLRVLDDEDLLFLGSRRVVQRRLRAGRRAGRGSSSTGGSGGRGRAARGFLLVAAAGHCRKDGDAERQRKQDPPFGEIHWGRPLLLVPAGAGRRELFYR